MKLNILGAVLTGGSNLIYSVRNFAFKGGQRYMKIDYVVLVCSLVFSVQAFGSNFDCSMLDEEAKQYGHRAYIGQVVERGRTQFYSAPNSKCPIKGKFVILNDVVIVYSEFNEFSQIMYPKGTEEDSGVWVYTKRIKITSKPDEVQSP